MIVRRDGLPLPPLSGIRFERTLVSSERSSERRIVMNWTQFLKNEIETAYATTAKLLDKVNPDRLDWMPQSGDNWMTVGQLLKHIGSGCGAGCKGFVTGDWGLPAGTKMEDLPPEEMLPPAEKLPTIESVEEARKLLSEDKSLAIRMIDQAGESDLAGRKTAAPWAPGVERELGWYLLQMVRHLEQHKGQLFYYLKLQGVPVNTLDLWG
jgi:DinB superfamily